MKSRKRGKQPTGNSDDLPLPEWLEEDYWAQLDPILERGIRLEKPEEENAIQKVVKLRPELRERVVRARLRRLRRRLLRRQKRRPHYSRYRWTPFLDAEMKEVADKRGWSEALKYMIERTGWPREAICRRAKKLGIDTKTQPETPWTDADVSFLINNAGHMSERKIARKLKRTVRSVESKARELGLSEIDAEEGYSGRRLADELGVSKNTVTKWVRSGLLKRGRYGQILEASFLKFLQQHHDLVNWDVLRPGQKRWLLGLLEGNKRVKAQKAAPAQVRPVRR
jgi:hypothetical protein